MVVCDLAKRFDRNDLSYAGGCVRHIEENLFEYFPLMWGLNILE
jgi:hypothetical protein